MKKFLYLVAVLAAAGLVNLSIVESAPPPAAKRINRAIELLAKDQPIYYTCLL